MVISSRFVCRLLCAVLGVAILSVSNLSLLPTDDFLGHSFFAFGDRGCHYEDAEGSFPRRVDKFEWEWRSSNPKCPIEDRLDPLLNGVTDEADDLDDSIATKRSMHQEKPLLILLVGDKLEERLVQFVCSSADKKSGFSMHKLPSTKGGDKKLLPRATEYCTNPEETVTLVHFPIYGMQHACGSSSKTKTDEFPSTAAQIRSLLPPLLENLPLHESVLVMTGSSLWDLSEGCNDKPHVAKQYRKLYRKGILQVHQALQDVLPNPALFWRTAPRISPTYDRMSAVNRRGRTLKNQIVLNDILRQTVAKLSMGVVVDWWKQFEKVPSQVIRTELPDGRLYGSEPSLAFFNLFLNAAKDHYPHLLP